MADEAKVDRYDNPAARLLTILNRGKGFEKNRTCRECWEELLEVPAASHGLLMARLGQVQNLPFEISQAVRAAYPQQAETSDYVEAHVSAAFMVQNLHAEWNSFRANVDHHVFTYLGLLAELLHAKSPATLMATEKVQKVREKLAKVLDEVLKSDEFPSDLKPLVARGLMGIIEAIDEYRLTGGVAVLVAAEAAIGKAAFSPTLWSTLTNTELGRRVLDGISAAADLATTATALPALSIVSVDILQRLSGG